ncbi:GAF domain-containing protein [Gottfriedia acidiceleris]|uniref:GAF domain-containing protein n=1 Tax=Gottfriedia acidiceleris TaxID=371036 RepID=UPI000B43D099|nr:GAF domain-containing protein [Gottfriedia acidiceleris]
MFQKVEYSGTKEQQYTTLTAQVKALIDGEHNLIANLANTSALLNQFLHQINWVGFYLKDGDRDELVLGPFVGLPACVRIPYGKGVCGTSAQTKTVQRIDNVHEFPGHIACDAASNSEIVIPLMHNGEVIGVLDIDSPEFNRFDEMDQKYLQAIVNLVEDTIK